MAEVLAFALVSSDEIGSTLKSCLQSIEGLKLSCFLAEDKTLPAQLLARRPAVLILEYTGLDPEIEKYLESATARDNADSFQAIGLVTEGADTLDSQFINRALNLTATFRLPEQTLALAGYIEKFCERKLAENTGRNKNARGKLYSVFSAKGGSGATTVATNMAYETHRLMQEPVLLLDMDQIYGNIAMRFNLKPDHCLRELAWTDINEVDDSVLRALVEKHPEGFDLLFSTNNVLDEADTPGVDLIAKCLDFALANYSYVFVDLPSYVLDANHQMIAERSDKLFLVTTLDVPGLYRTRQYLNLAKRELDADKLEIIVNRWDLQGSYGISNSDLEKELGLTVFAHLADDWKLNTKANSLGLLLSQVDAQCDLSSDLQKIVANLTDLGLRDLQPMKTHNAFSKLKVAGVGTGIMNAILKGFDLNVVKKA